MSSPSQVLLTDPKLHRRIRSLSIQGEITVDQHPATTPGLAEGVGPAQVDIQAAHESVGSTGDTPRAAHENGFNSASAPGADTGDPEPLTATNEDNCALMNMEHLTQTVQEQPNLQTPEAGKGSPSSKTNEEQNPLAEWGFSTDLHDALDATAGDEAWVPDPVPADVKASSLSWGSLGNRSSTCAMTFSTGYFVEGVECLDYYTKGGYHPVCIDDELCSGRYHVLHKLGHGSYSTVWLAVDQTEKRHVALKIGVANPGEDDRESEMLRLLSKGDVKHPGRSFVATILDEFSIDGPNGCHKCLVSEPAGCSVSVEKGEYQLPIKVARTVVAQALLGLSYIHSCGVVHGDLHSGNLLFSVVSLDDCTTIEEVYDRIGKPKEIDFGYSTDGTYNDSIPDHVVRAAYMGVDSEAAVGAHIKVHDFGASCLIGEKRTELKTPMALRPPESFFEEDLGPAADMWTLACTIYECFSHGGLFEIWFPPPDKDDYLVEMADTFGKLPERWMAQWELKDEWFLPDGSWRQGKSKTGNRILPKPHRPFSKRLKEMQERRGMQIPLGGAAFEGGELGDEELASLGELLRAMFMYEPSQRITAEEAVQSDWMKRWGYPAIEEFGRPRRASAPAGATSLP